MTEIAFDGKKVLLTENQWEKKLSPEQYKILREKKTETPFVNSYYDHKEKGLYLCTGCSLPLFSSLDKYESGSGWPSFTKPINNKNIIQIKDLSLGMNRVEISCARCNCHLGHVFNDGPSPTFNRFCINSIALHFIKKS